MSDYLFGPAPHVLSGETTDVYFLHTRRILEAEARDPAAVMEVFPARQGILCGIREVEALLRKILPAGAELWALAGGDAVAAHEVAVRIHGPYRSYAIYETAILGILSHETGWATAARECVDAADGVPVISFGARHVHPLVAPYLDYAAIVGGCAAGSTPLGSRMAGKEPAGTMPHALILTIGDTVEAALAFGRYIEADIPRTVLVDTFLDEPQEAIRVATALGQKLSAVRLDTPFERGGVTPALVREVRARLDQGGFPAVGIFVSGGVTPDRIRSFREEGATVDGYGVGGYITSASPNDFTADLKQIDGRPVAKRGRIPGVTASPRLKRVR